MWRVAALAPLALISCGPVPLAQAERECLEEARLAQRPRGEVAVGIGSDGRIGGAFDITIGSDYLAGRDPAAVYDLCVQRKSGQPPSRPLYSFPEWKG
jgi:hypothetical protein